MKCSQRLFLALLFFRTLRTDLPSIRNIVIGDTHSETQRRQNLSISRDLAYKLQSNYRCANNFKMPNGVDQRSDDAIACTSRFCVQNTESFRVRYAEALNRFERNTFKIFYSIDHVKNFDAKLSRSALRSCDKLRGSVRIVQQACVDLFPFFDWFRFPSCYTSHSNNSILLLRTFHRVCLRRVLTGILPAEHKRLRHLLKFYCTYF